MNAYVIYTKPVTCSKYLMEPLVNVCTFIKLYFEVISGYNFSAVTISSRFNQTFQFLCAYIFNSLYKCLFYFTIVLFCTALCTFTLFFALFVCLLLFCFVLFCFVFLSFFLLQYFGLVTWTIYCKMHILFFKKVLKALKKSTKHINSG